MDNVNSTLSVKYIIKELNSMDNSIRIVENADGVEPALLVAYIEIDRLKDKLFALENKRSQE